VVLGQDLRDDHADSDVDVELESLSNDQVLTDPHGPGEVDDGVSQSESGSEADDEGSRLHDDLVEPVGRREWAEKVVELTGACQRGQASTARLVKGLALLLVDGPGARFTRTGLRVGFLPHGCPGHASGGSRGDAGTGRSGHKGCRAWRAEVTAEVPCSLLRLPQADSSQRQCTGARSLAGGERLHCADACRLLGSQGPRLRMPREWRAVCRVREQPLHGPLRLAPALGRLGPAGDARRAAHEGRRPGAVGLGSPSVPPELRGQSGASGTCWRRWPICT
jgi:hypothetical protein